MDNNQKEQMKKTVRDLASHTEKAASMAKDKISQQMEQENVKKAAETAAKGARKASSGISAFWKKRTRKQKVILAVLAVVLVCGIFAGGGKGVPDNILDYLGTKENVVYQTYDKDDFEHQSDSGSITNVHKYEGNLPYLVIGSSGEVEMIEIVDRVSKESFHVNGLHVGDDLKQVEKWMKKSNVDWELDSSGTMGIYRYKGKEVLVTIICEGGYARVIMAAVSKR